MVGDCLAGAPEPDDRSTGTGDALTRHFTTWLPSAATGPAMRTGRPTRCEGRRSLVPVAPATVRFARRASPPRGGTDGHDEHIVVGLIVRRLRWALLALGSLATFATIGYVAVEGYGWLDAFFMTVVTLSTVGYGEIRPLDSAGRLFTVGVIIASFATLAYAVGTLTDLFTSGEASTYLHEWRSKRMRDDLVDHVIIVGFGRVGQAAARSVVEIGRRCLIIERNGSVERAIQDSGCIPLIGDATSEQDLLNAGIRRATALIAAADEDDVNLIVALTARALRSDLRIVSRVNDATWAERIRRAGADVAQSPYQSYGRTLAASAVTPGVLDVHDLPLLGLGTEEIEIPPRSPFTDRGLEEIQAAHPGVFIVGLRRDQRFRPWHDIEGTIRSGDILVALGTHEALHALATQP
jgi:voltage-gated potassium channel